MYTGEIQTERSQTEEFGEKKEEHLPARVIELPD